MARGDRSAVVPGGRFIQAGLAGLAWAALVVSAGPAVAADGASWLLMERHGGCFDLGVLVRRERLPRAPTSPDEFAAMMRMRGHQVTVGPLPGSPPDLVGKAVVVDVRDDLKPVFVRAELCRPADR